MSTTITIPAMNLSANQVLTLNPTTLTPGQFASYSFSLSRTQTPTPLNGLTQGSDAMDMVLQFSEDGGTSFPITDAQEISGGTFLGKQGQTITTSTFGSTIAPAANQVKGSVTARQAFSVSGSLTLT